MKSASKVPISKSIMDRVVSLAIYLYFVLGFFVFFWPVYLFFYFLSPGGEKGFRLANHYYLRLFFKLAKMLVPGLTINLPAKQEISDIKSSVVICNHVSFLDPLLLISIFSNSATIVKEAHIRFPFFGWIMKKSGFISASTASPDELWSDKLLHKAQKTLAEGGVVFIFPEGTRSVDGRVKQFKKGAFFFAKTLEAPIEMFYLAGTDSLFPPGRVLFNTRPDASIELKRLGRLEMSGQTEKLSARKIRDKAYQKYIHLDRI